MKHVLYSIIALALLASCNGNSGQNQTQEQADTFYSGTMGGSGQAAGGNEGEEYRSTGDQSLLDVSLPANLTDEVLRYKAITIHFNSRYRVPNCVAYELTNTQVAMADAPDAERRDNYNFNRDTRVDGCPDWWEYKETGYDRGHMAPAMDMRWSRQAMEQCFLMTNICPQDHELNDGEWRHMEEAIHTWAKRTERLVIFTGPVLRNDMKRIGKHRNIAVPSKFYKVVYDPKQKKAIAFLFKNEKARNSWTNYAVSVDEVEQLTGIDFLAALPDDVETTVESKQSIGKWPRYTPRR
ncbi:MAG: DNA/RNA non-specific endonuclease [Muribaculaceae bacterium]|nr:DNA/RNA non-specific endonuclease [Muribaculaceae bacterium]